MSVFDRRKFIGSGLAASALASLGAPLRAFAQGGEIVIGAAPPISGVFAFAGAGLHAALADWVRVEERLRRDRRPEAPLSRRGFGLQGRPGGRDLQEDHGAVEAAGVLRRLDRLGEGDRAGGEPDGHGDDLRAVVLVRPRQPREGAVLLHGRPDLCRDDRDPPRVREPQRRRRDQALGRIRLLRHRVRARSDRGRQGKGGEARHSGRARDHHQAGRGRRLGRDDQAAPRQARLRDLPRLRARSDPGVHPADARSGAELARHGHDLEHGQDHHRPDGRRRRRLPRRDAVPLFLRAGQDGGLRCDGRGRLEEAGQPLAHAVLYERLDDGLDLRPGHLPHPRREEGAHRPEHEGRAGIDQQVGHRRDLRRAGVVEDPLHPGGPGVSR